MNGHLGPQELVKLAQPFKIVAFDWDGTAVMGRKEDAGAVCQQLERLMKAGVAVVVITGTNLTNTVNQLAPVVRGRFNRNLFIATNRGSEVYGFDGRPDPIPLWTRKATPDEERKLTEAADALRDELSERTGLPVKVIYDRLNRRKVDIIPEPQWADPPKSQIGALLEAVQGRLSKGGLNGGLREVLDRALKIAAEKGLTDPRVTSDVKHIEIGLTDKSDSVEWMFKNLCRERGVRPEQILIAGDEFGSIGGAEGSDYKMVTPHSQGAVFISVGPEPGGVAPGILHVGGGPARFREVLSALADIHEGKRAAGQVPRSLDLPLTPTPDPGWRIVSQGIDLAREHEIESLFSIANGYLGSRGSLDEGNVFASSPATFLAGVFDTMPLPAAVPEFAVAPDWSRLRLSIAGREVNADPQALIEHLRVLDLHQAALFREWRHKDGDGRITLFRSVRLACQDDRHLALQSLLVIPENYSGRFRLEAIIEPARLMVNGLPVARPRMIPSYDAEARDRHDPAVLVFRAPGTGLTAAIASLTRFTGPAGQVKPARIDRGEGTLTERWDLELRLGESYRLDRLVSFVTTRDSQQPVHDAAARLEGLRDFGPEQVATRHAKSWKECWDATDIAVEGDEEAQQALRFAAYHLVSAANPDDERVSIGARTLTGDSYKGHVFWDTDIFILPQFTFTNPKAARALLMYRHHTLPAAREKARAIGKRGALYAWESADTGAETTPRFMLAPDGEVIRILCGEQEQHISADVAYSYWQYWQATGDEAFISGPGAEVLLETARFWASRGELGPEGRYHIRGVIGPDEYHETIDDNAYTNRMAQWNLERGLEVAELLSRRFPSQWRELRARLDLQDEELAQWRDLAGRVHLVVDAATHVVEQFDGYFKLEDYDLSPMRAQGKRAAPMDMLLGRHKIQRSKVLKQADVVMLTALLWDRFPPEVREASFRYYEPRTSHGSSLSPAAHAWVAARLGMMQTAEEYFHQAARIDLANNMGNAAGGVHAAALGGLWQAAVFGFAGVHPREEGLFLSPRLPASWKTLRVPLHWRGARLMLTLSQRAPQMSVRVVSGGPVAVQLEGGQQRHIGAGQELTARQDAPGWSIQP